MYITSNLKSIAPNKILTKVNEHLLGIFGPLHTKLPLTSILVILGGNLFQIGKNTLYSMGLW